MQLNISALSRAAKRAAIFIVLYSINRRAICIDPDQKTALYSRSGLIQGNIFLRKNSAEVFRREIWTAGVLIICVVGASCFWAIEKFVNDSRLANFLKLLVVLICVGRSFSGVLPLAKINWF
jgi:hypothetical protein